MRMYLCELVFDGVVIERFYRRGESAQAVREGLDMFRWTAGEWKVRRAERDHAAGLMAAADALRERV